MSEWLPDDWWAMVTIVVLSFCGAFAVGYLIAQLYGPRRGSGLSQQDKKEIKKYRRYINSMNKINKS